MFGFDTEKLFADIYGNFAVVLNTLIDKIKNTVNDGYWVVLQNLVSVKLKKKPEITDNVTDSDSDGVPDIYEFKSLTPKVISYTTSLGTYNSIRVFECNSNPAVKDTDGDGSNDAEDFLPLEKFKTPVILLHGRDDNSYWCFGAKSAISNTWHYDGDKSGDTNGYTDVTKQIITKIDEGDAKNKLNPKNLAYEIKSVNGMKENLFAFNYPNQDMVNKNSEKLQKYLDNLSKDRALSTELNIKGKFYATKADAVNKNFKLNFIGQSMGGLVARYYIENMGGNIHADKLITIDTPHWGSTYGYASNLIDLFPKGWVYPCDIDLQPDSKMFGGNSTTIVSMINPDRARYINDNQTSALTTNHSNTKYYAIAGYANDFNLLLPSDMINRNFMFNVTLQTDTFNNFRDSIAESFYNTCGYRDKISFIFGMTSDDNVVDIPSQFGLSYSIFSGNRDNMLIMNKYAMNIDTYFGHTPLNSFHLENHHREEVCNRITGKKESETGIKIKGYLDD